MFHLMLATCMAENSEGFCREIARFIDRQIHIPTCYIGGIPWQDRERMFDEGEIHILWLCGLAYVDKADAAVADLELLAVPIPKGERYRGRPVYFSDVVVRRDRPFESFFDLRGRSWAYNEPRSHSGFNVVRAFLAEWGQTDKFFRAVFESGAHSASVEMVLSGQADGAAIDSMVLEWFMAQQADLADRIRVLDAIGPSPIPPWVISRRVPLSIRCDVRNVLLGMHEEQSGRALLERARLERFVTAADRDYDPVRAIARKAQQISWA